jgi:hypothetical protein
MMASNLCARGVFTLPDESLAKMAGKILNINRGTPFRMQTGGTMSSKPASAAAMATASITLSPPTGSINWGGMTGNKTIIPEDCLLLSAVIRTSWYSSSYANYNSVHFVHAQTSTMPVEFVGGVWGFTTVSYKLIHRSFSNAANDMNFITTTANITPGNATFTINPLSNSASYNYFNPAYCNLDTANWLIKYPTI